MQSGNPNRFTFLPVIDLFIVYTIQNRGELDSLLHVHFEAVYYNSRSSSARCTGTQPRHVPLLLARLVTLLIVQCTHGDWPYYYTRQDSLNRVGDVQFLKRKSKSHVDICTDPRPSPHTVNRGEQLRGLHVCIPALQTVGVSIQRPSIAEKNSTLSSSDGAVVAIMDGGMGVVVAAVAGSVAGRPELGCGKNHVSHPRRGVTAVPAVDAMGLARARQRQ